MTLTQTAARAALIEELALMVAPPDGHSRGLRGDGRVKRGAGDAYTQQLRKTGSEPGERRPEIICTAIKA